MQKNILIFFIGILCTLILAHCGFKDERVAEAQAAAPAPAEIVATPQVNDVAATNEVKETFPFEICLNDILFNFSKNKNGEYEGTLSTSTIKSISINVSDELYLKYQILYKLKNSEEDTVKILDEEVLENQKQKIILKLPNQNELSNVSVLKINFERIYKDRENIKFTILLEDKKND